MKRPWVTCLVLLAGCGAEPGLSDFPEVLRVEVVDTLVGTESGALAFAVDLDVAPDGRLYAADYQADQLFSVDPETRDTLRIGRPGDGPGEFDAPWTVRALGGSILVVDRGNGRVQRLDSTGGYVSSHPVTPMVVRSFPFLSADGDVVIATGGHDSTLVIVFDSTATERFRVGEPVVTPPAVADFRAIKAQIREGRIPDDLRNEALAASAPGGRVWIALQTEGEVRRYTRDGGLEWATPVDEPEMVASRDTFFSRNLDDANPSRLYSLRYFRDVVVAGEELWVLLDTTPGSPGVILVFDDAGRYRRMEVAGGGGAAQMAVDLARRRLFLFTGHDAQLLMGPLPPGP